MLIFFLQTRTRFRSILSTALLLFLNVLIYILVFLEPNDESGANVDAAKMWRENRDEFNKIAEKLVRKTLGIPTNP